MSSTSKFLTFVWLDLFKTKKLYLQAIEVAENRLDLVLTRSRALVQRKGKFHRSVASSPKRFIYTIAMFQRFVDHDRHTRILTSEKPDVDGQKLVCSQTGNNTHLNPSVPHRLNAKPNTSCSTCRWSHLLVNIEIGHIYTKGHTA